MWMFSVEIIVWFLVTSSNAVLQDYCLRDTFEANCHDNEVVVMTAARYGRRQLGKCIRKDFGYLGCGQEVISQADRVCSGHQQCLIDVFKTFGDLRPCSELESYLEAEYDCMQVMEINTLNCFAAQSEPITLEKGLISSYFVDRVVHPDQNSCTLKLKAKSGQRWNISLVDFGVPRTHSLSTSRGSFHGSQSPEDSESARLPVCRQYAVIRDERSSAKSVVCGEGAVRDKVVHISTGHLIQVEIFSRSKDPGSSTQFLLRVEAIGCPDLELPNVVVVWRDSDRLQVKCNSSSGGELYEMICINKIWTGDINCNKERVLSFWQRIQYDWTSRPAYGILLMTILGVILGIIIGCSMLAISVLCRRRRSRLHSLHKNPTEIQKTLLVRKSVDSLGRNFTRSVDNVMAIDVAMEPIVSSSTARAIWPQQTTTTSPLPPGGARIDDYFVPHKYSLRTHTEADNGRDLPSRHRHSTDFETAMAGANDPVEDGCRYHACLQKIAAVATPETEVGGRRMTTFDARNDSSSTALQPMSYSESSGYGNSSASLSTAEHIYEIPE